MDFLSLNKQYGTGLIEVLITTVVVAVGLLAVASLQVDFIASSGDSKTRAEALVLAEKKLEELRNEIVRDDGTGGGYDTILNDPSPVTDDPATTAGTNAVFTRTWVINQGGTAERKKISVLVTWDSDGGTDSDGDGNIIDDDERINVVTEMVFSDPAKSALYAGVTRDRGIAIASPRQNASEDISAVSDDVVGTNLAITGVGDADGTVSVDQQLQVAPDGNSLILSQVAPNSHFYTAVHSDYPAKIEAGVIAVFLCDGITSTCSHIQNYFGGIVHRVIGTIYSTSGHNLSSQFVVWTSSETHACYNGAVIKGDDFADDDIVGSDIDKRPYECVYAGNCNASDAGTRTASGGDSPVDQGCFVDATVSDTQINTRNVGPGGEYGYMGLLGLDHQGSDAEQVCFLENTVAINSPIAQAGSNKAFNENYLYPSTKRLYVTRRLKRNGSINDHKNEGINRSYTNHNFFIAAHRTGSNTKTECRNKVVTAHAKEVAPREISRALNEGTANTAAYEASYYGGAGEAHTLIGNVSGNATKLSVFISEIGACYLNNNLDGVGSTATGYACVIGSNASIADIIGSSDEYKSSGPSVFSTCSRDANTDFACDWTTNFTDTYDDGGVGDGRCTTPWGDDIDDTTTVSAYSISNCIIAVSRDCSNGILGGDATAIYQASAPCYAAANAGVSCALWAGGTLVDEETEDIFNVDSVAYGNSCPSAITVTCNEGTLFSGGSLYTGGKFQNCIVEAACFVPYIVGDGTNNTAKLTTVYTTMSNAELLGSGTNIGTGAKKVQTQSPTAKTAVTCGSEVTFTYNQ